MRTIRFLAFQLLAVLFMLNCYAEAKICPGCVQDADPNDPEIRRELVGLLTAQSEDCDIIKVIRAKTQVVSGFRYIVDFIVKDHLTKKVKVCFTSFVSQPWISKLPIVEIYECHYRDERLGF